MCLVITDLSRSNNSAICDWLSQTVSASNCTSISVSLPAVTNIYIFFSILLLAGFVAGRSSASCIHMLTFKITKPARRIQFFNVFP